MLGQSHNRVAAPGPKRIIIGVSGATGIVYAIRLLEVLRELGIAASDGQTKHKIGPATEAPIVETALATAEDAGATIRAARTAFDDGPGPRMTPDDVAAVVLPSLTNSNITGNVFDVDAGSLIA